VKLYDIGFNTAVKLAIENSHSIGREILPIALSVGRVLSDPVFAFADSPSLESSLKDGYAVISSDINHASLKNSIPLEVIGEVAAGDHIDQHLHHGAAIRVLSGAPLPAGADAVLADEFTRKDGKFIFASATAEPGRNVLPKGSDVTRGVMLADTGQTLTPQLIGLLVAGGIFEVAVFIRPRIGLLATGSEILLPGELLTPGKLYASNMAFQQAWFCSMGFESRMMVSKDSVESIADAIRQISVSSDVIITSGGAWKSDRDLVVKVLNSLGWKMLFHRVRMGPGKAVAMGILDNKPVFCLPGGPASNESAFMMIVFPAIYKIAGFKNCPYISLRGKLEKEITGQIDWTQFVQCQIIQKYPEIILRPQKLKSRLIAMSKTQAIVTIPEGTERINAGATVPFVCYNRDLFSFPLSAGNTGISKDLV